MGRRSGLPDRPAPGLRRGDQIRVLIIDDHALFIEAIRPTIEGSGATEIFVAPTGAEGIEIARRERPDVVCLDLGLPDLPGIAVGREILEMCPEARVIALTSLRNDATVREALRSGFSGYITKDTSIRRFLTSLQAVVEGRIVAPRSMSPSKGARTEQERALELLVERLTVRELEVLELLATGRSGGEIARRLGISKNTVRTHIQSILAKLHVHSQLEAVAFAVRNGIVSVRRPTAM